MTCSPIPLPTREIRLTDYRLNPMYLLGPVKYPNELPVRYARRAQHEL